MPFDFLNKLPSIDTGKIFQIVSFPLTCKKINKESKISKEKQKRNSGKIFFILTKLLLSLFFYFFTNVVISKVIFAEMFTQYRF